MLKVKEGNFHVHDGGPINKIQGRQYKSFKAGDEVPEEFASKLLAKGTVLEGKPAKKKKPVELKEETPVEADTEKYFQELVDLDKIGKVTARKLVDRYPNRTKLIEALLEDKQDVLNRFNNGIVEVLEVAYL